MLTLIVIQMNGFTGWTTWFLFSTALLSRIYLSSRIKPIKYLTVTLCWIYLEFSFPGFYLAHYILQGSEFSSSSWTFNLGLTLISMLGPVFFIATLIEKKNLKTKLISPNLKRVALALASGFLFSCVLSYLSYKLGITKMGVAHPELPFKLEPLLNLARSISIPCFFTLIIFYSFSSKFLRFGSIALYIIWLCIEIYIRGSRGVLMIGLFPVMILILKLVIIRKSLIILALLIPIGLGSYALGDMLREQYTSGTYTISNESLLSKIAPKMWNTYFRTFNEVPIFGDLKKEFKHGFFANNFSMLMEYGGSNKYYTHNIIGFELDAPHAQGVTALSDGYAYFGEFGTYFTLLVLLSLAIANDLGRFPLFNSNLATQALLSFQIWMFFMWGDGLYDFYFTRSIFTILVFPASALVLNFLLKNITSSNGRDLPEDRPT